jgi:hypothetical protein
MHPQIEGVRDYEWPMVLAQVDELERDSPGAAPIDHDAIANCIEFGLKSGTLEPPDPPFWWAVVAELRSRAA